MIGMVNVPHDSPIDYYAEPVKTRKSHTFSDKSNKGIKVKRPSGHRPLFFRRKAPHIDYTNDGRKLSDGTPVQNDAPSKLWTELIVRSFVNKVENEIQSPVDAYKNIQHEFEKLNLSDKNKSSSTFSLVSNHRIGCISCDDDSENSDFDEENKISRTPSLPDIVSEQLSIPAPIQRKNTDQL